MELEKLSGVATVRKLIYGNIAALLVAAMTIVWNWATLSSRVRTLEQNHATDVTFIWEHIDRLEQLHLQPVPTGELYLFPPVENPPRRSAPLDKEEERG